MSRATRRGCYTDADKPKRRHISWASAEAHAAAQEIIARRKYTAYICPLCDYLHIGRVRNIDPIPPEPLKSTKKWRRHEENQAGRIAHYLRLILDK